MAASFSGSTFGVVFEACSGAFADAADCPIADSRFIGPDFSLVAF
jgi:hypothetical protein